MIAMSSLWKASKVLNFSGQNTLRLNLTVSVRTNENLGFASAKIFPSPLRKLFRLL